MKIFITLLIATVSMTAFAHEGGDFGTVICMQNREQSNPRIQVVLHQIANTRYYNMEVTTRQYGEKKLLVAEKVRVTTEDVMTFFKGRHVSLHMYMDELDQSNLYYKDQTIQLTCRANVWGL